MSLKKQLEIIKKLLTSTKLNDILIFVANEAMGNDCSLKTKQSRNVNVLTFSLL